MKAVVFGGRGAVIRAARFPAAEIRGTPELEGMARPGHPPVVAVSVHEGHLGAVRERLPDQPVQVLGRDVRIPVENRTRRPEQTGHDRLCAALAAHARSGGAAVAVGAGTAVTVDAVDPSGAFLGGAVAPGIGAARQGLRGAAAGLPPPDLRRGRAIAFPGRTTEEALRAGFLLGFAGLVDRLAEAAVRAASGGGGRGRRVPVFLHGGDAGVLAPLLRSPVVLAPHLVAEGARLAWLRARGE